MEINLYLVGVDVDDACATFPFDSFESAESYAKDNPGTCIYSVGAFIDFDSIRKVDYADYCW